MSSIPVLTPDARHFARRWSGGLNPHLVTQVQHRGGGRPWFTSQLSPAQLADTYGEEIKTWFPRLRRTPEQLFNLQAGGGEGVWETLADLGRFSVAMQIHSNRQVKEQLVSFWSNLLHVPIDSDPAGFWRVAYDQTIRRYSLDTFENLLQHAITHPAMGLSLNNAESTKDAPNENLGRELLELHTVGVESGFTEADVKASAKLLTGYRVWVWYPSFTAAYTPGDHYTGPLSVLGFHHDNADPDGRAATAAYLRYLAHDPATATRLARRLCVKFANENPSDDLVSTVAKAYLDHGTAITPTLLALVGHPEFVDPVKSMGAKLRTPQEDYVATVRALSIQLSRPTADASFANAMLYQCYDLGQHPFGWSAPNGYPEVNAAWASAGRILTSFAMHRSVACKFWPNQGAVLWKKADLVPRLPTTLSHLIDAVGLKVLGQSPGPELTRGIATVLGMPQSLVLGPHELTDYWLLRTILTSLLDSPLHLHR